MNFSKILAFIAAGIALFIIITSAVYLCRTDVVPGEGLRKIDPMPSQNKADATSFDLIGQLRIATRPDSQDKKSVLILHPWLKYDSSDTALYEELDRKLPAIKSIFMRYFQTRTKQELLQKEEDQIKTELKAQINELLVLGKISEIYFNDYIYLN